MSCRLTKEMVENVIYNNWEEVDNYNPQNILINLNKVQDICFTVRIMYSDIMKKYIDEIQDENFYYGIPTIERKDIIKYIKAIYTKFDNGINIATYNAILANSLASLEYLMLIEYEKAIDADDCESIIFNFK